MALVSFPSSRPNFDQIIQHSLPYLTKFHGRIHASAVPDMVKKIKRASEVKQLRKSAKLCNVPFKGYRFVLSFTDGSRRTHMPFAMDQLLSSIQSMYSELNDFPMNKWEGTHDISQRLSDYDNVPVEHIFAHQSISQFGYPALAFTVANALILAVPSDALAETCDANGPLFNMPLLLAVALIGATVGGLLARQRRGELKRLNDQLRQINAALRRQAKIESYAPTLSYAPIGSRIPEDEVIVDSKKHELISHLKTGKNFLRNQYPEKAFVEFKAALELAQNLEDPIEEKKAARGLGASLQRQGKYREAIKYHSMVLAISEQAGEDSGNTEAYGAIADCYTELGDLERAGKFYDNYIARLETD